jgi:hypothetical protein
MWVVLQAIAFFSQSGGGRATALGRQETGGKDGKMYAVNTGQIDGHLRGGLFISSPDAGF